MGEVIVLSGYRPEPHVTIQCDESHCHVVPVAYLRSIVDRASDLEPLPACLVRVMVGFFLSGSVLDDQ